MPLKRLTPNVQLTELGYLRLWQDELREIVRLARQLEGAEVRIEADNCLLDDVETDLPELGPRLGYFSVTATEAMTTPGNVTPDEPLAPRELISLRLSRNRCRIQADDPNLTVTGLIEAIQRVTDKCRRMPRWLVPFFRSTPASEAAAAGVVVSTLVGLVSLSFIIADAIVIVQGPGQPPGWRGSVPWGVVAAAVLAAVAFGWPRARTVLYTATRREAPTFWQEYRGHIGIALVSGAVFYLLGLLTPRP